ncbi:hypothetical protein TRIP_B200782 [uncultured Desulfatiglans sp.]|uniref:Uncharacterized protein n=1 Tax=Uncultured Desulfatiglans sp. TaxID=1748965 RepID=A0A653A4Q6_UNCDX|nr:hypothetical protein TRIP_B200782 [uncultured Desulfatiglans sp.]
MTSPIDNTGNPQIKSQENLLKEPADSTDRMGSEWKNYDVRRVFQKELPAWKGVLFRVLLDHTGLPVNPDRGYKSKASDYTWKWRNIGIHSEYAAASCLLNLTSLPAFFPLQPNNAYPGGQDWGAQNRPPYRGPIADNRWNEVDFSETRSLSQTGNEFNLSEDLEDFDSLQNTGHPRRVPNQIHGADGPNGDMGHSNEIDKEPISFGDLENIDPSEKTTSPQDDHKRKAPTPFSKDPIQSDDPDGLDSKRQIN